MAVPFEAIANLIIKATDNMNRGVENATKAGDGNNGQNYQIAKGESSEGSGGSGVEQIKTTEQDMSAYQNAQDNMKNIGNMAKDFIKNKLSDNGDTSSDERLKRIFNRENDALKCFAKIDAIMFEYNNKAKEIHPDGENHVDDDTHYGVKAQDLAKNPYTQSVVSEDKDGFLQVDPAELATANTAVIGEICRRLLTIEKVLGLEVK